MLLAACQTGACMHHELDPRLMGIHAEASVSMYDRLCSQAKVPIRLSMKCKGVTHVRHPQLCSMLFTIDIMYVKSVRLCWPPAIKQLLENSCATLVGGFVAVTSSILRGSMYASNAPPMHQNGTVGLQCLCTCARSGRSP